MTDDGFDRCDECGRRTAHMPGCVQGHPAPRPAPTTPASPWRAAANRLDARQPYNDPWRQVSRDDYLAAVRRFSQKAITP